MTTAYEFQVFARDGAARTGQVGTAHGAIATPAFMPVGTAATVKAMTPEAVAETGADIVLANTYHLMLRPGAERVAGLGGLHGFMHWQRPILTDSGGFQVYSLSGLRKLDEAGVTFKSHIDGTEMHLSPERSIEVQHLLDALTPAHRTTVLEQLAALCYLLASGQAPEEVHAFLCGATLIASPKPKQGGSPSDSYR